MTILKIVNKLFARSLDSAHNPVFYALASWMSIDKLLQKNIAHLSKENIERTFSSVFSKYLR